MPLFRLSESMEFPPAWLARLDGLLCIGGDLSPDRIVAAYRRGIFPWFSSGEPILWWSPDPRLVLIPEQVHLSRRLAKTIRSGRFQITLDRNFAAVIRECARVRTEKGEETWLVDPMIRAYSELHTRGLAHSVEVWQDGNLAGGLYGLALGGIFFGESMFSRVSDASKTPLVALSALLAASGFILIDGQVTTRQLLSMGAMEIPRELFLTLLEEGLARPDLTGPWNFRGFPERHSSGIRMTSTGLTQRRTT